MKKSLLIIICLFIAMFSSCTSMKDISINSSRSQSEQKFTELETVIVPLEALGPNEARNRISDITAARQLIVHMEKEASIDTDFSAKLMAWSGRLAILEGRYSEAQRLYRQSSASSPGNIPSVILSIRLEGDPLKRMEIIEKELALLNQRSPGIGELNIEKGRALLELNRFLESAGAFDIAFSSRLEKIYNESYAADRNRAWEMRNSSGVAAGSLGLLGRESISWNDCINLTKNETQLLRFITGGRNLTDAELFNRLIDRAFVPFAQDITMTQWPNEKPKVNETVTRAGAAWYIWHLYAETRADRGLLSRYSARYATGANPRSPIADVPHLSPYFDSILGCVEREFMSLPDGRNFQPVLPMRGTELLSALKKIDN